MTDMSLMDCEKGKGDRTRPVLDGSLSSVVRLSWDLLWLYVIHFYYFFVAFLRCLFPRGQKCMKDNVVVVTGAGGGIGRELCKRFFDLGSSVVCVDINESANKETVNCLTPNEGNKNNTAVGFVCDVTKPSDVAKLAENVIQKFGSVDILIHNAGILGVHKFLSGSDEFLTKIIDVNLMSAFWVVRAFLPSMLKHEKGQIVFMNSMSAIHALTNAPTYSASKSGLKAIADSLRSELAQDPRGQNIIVTSIHPYFVDTAPGFLKHVSCRLVPLSVDDAVNDMMVGIRREYQQFAVPGPRFNLTLVTIPLIFPYNFMVKLREVFYAAAVFPDGCDTYPPERQTVKSERNGNIIEQIRL